MSVVLCGETKLAHIMVTDAMGTIIVDQTTSFKDCILMNKVSMLKSSNTVTFFALVGDNTLRKAVNAFDYWAFIHNKPLNFFDSSTKQSLCQIATHYLEVYRFNKIPPTFNKATVYFINNERISEQCFIRENNQYFPNGGNGVLEENNVILNYSGDKIDLNFNPQKLEDHFPEAIKLIEQEHIERKKKEVGLKYDFDNRFCGVLIPKDQSGKIEYLNPYKHFGEAIIHQDFDILGAKVWDFMEQQKNWNPFET